MSPCKSTREGPAVLASAAKASHLIVLYTGPAEWGILPSRTRLGAQEKIEDSLREFSSGMNTNKEHMCNPREGSSISRSTKPWKIASL